MNSNKITCALQISMDIIDGKKNHENVSVERINEWLEERFNKLDIEDTEENKCEIRNLAFAFENFALSILKRDFN